MSAGDIGATVKLKATKTNDTLSSGNNSFPTIPFPEPKFRTAIKSESEGEEEIRIELK